MSLKQKSKRQLMVERQIQKIISEEMLMLNQNCVTLTEVDISPDFKNCVLLVDSIILNRENSISFVEKKIHLLQRALASKMSTKSTPKLRVKWDDRREKFISLQNAINR